MLHVCVQRLDVIDIFGKIFGTKQGLIRSLTGLQNWKCGVGTCEFRCVLKYIEQLA